LQASLDRAASEFRLLNQGTLTEGEGSVQFTSLS
jgi:hypothetical protein